VYDAPELTRTVRVGSDGDIACRCSYSTYRAAGLYPAELENPYQALTSENVLVDPIVTVLLWSTAAADLRCWGCEESSDVSGHGHGDTS